jgi:glycosyltransferase involved in cell wall biosynthesis
MKLSVVVICLNEERHLARCLAALTGVDRCGLDVEIVVADGGSTDRSREIALSYGARVVDSPRGIPVQRNVGARAATGEILAYVDADVEILDGWFATVARHFADSPRRILGCAPRLAADASWIARAYALHWGCGSDGAEAGGTATERGLSTQSLILARDVFDLVGGFREDLGVDEDTVLLVEARQRNIPLISDCGLAYIHHGEPRTLGEFFRRIKWGTNAMAWYRSILQGNFSAARRNQYLYGAAIAIEVAFLALSVQVASIWNWRTGIVLSLGLLAASILVPAASTALRRGCPRNIGPLCVMYAAFGLATASAMAGLGSDKSKRWR